MHDTNKYVQIYSINFTSKIKKNKNDLLRHFFLKILLES